MKLMDMLETKLKISGHTTREDDQIKCATKDLDEDSDCPEVLPILRRSSSNKQKKKCDLTEDTGIVSTAGRMKYEDMLTVLKCRHCSELTSPPLVQCRKGHIYCRACKVNNKLIQCGMCKQTFVDAPNQALDQLVRLIAIPCKYGTRGCAEFVFLDSRLQHETLCKFRPVHCQFEKHGCKAIFSIKDMRWHHKMCEFAHYPHPNVLPSMPTRKKSQKTTADEDGQEVGCNAEVAAVDPLRQQSDLTNGGLPPPAIEKVAAASYSAASTEAVSGCPTVAGAAVPQENLSSAAGCVEPAANPSVQVQTEIKLFPGVLSRD